MNTAIPTVNLTVRIYDQDGGPVKDALIVASLSTPERYKGFIIPEEFRGTTDEDGRCVIKVFPNELGTEGSEYRIIMKPKHGRSITVFATVPNVDCNLEEISNLEPYPVRGAGDIITAKVMANADSARQAANEARCNADYVRANLNTATEGAVRAETAKDQAETHAAMATTKAELSTVKASLSGASAITAGAYSELAHAWAESAASPDPDNHPGSASAKSWAEDARKTTQQLPVVATATTSPRTLADRFADTVNVKDFGAKGDGHVKSIPVSQQRPKPLVLIVAGQSNAVGTSGAAGSISVPVGAYWNSTTMSWVSPIADPVFPSLSGGFVPKLVEHIVAQTGRPVYIINQARGSTNCANNYMVANGSWGSEGIMRPLLLSRMGDALEALDSQGIAYDIIGTVWLQGETDAVSINLGYETLADYTENINSLLSWAINLIGGKIFVAPIGYNASTVYDADVDAVNAALTSAVNANADAIMSTTMTTTFRANGYLIDSWHYTQAAYNLLGAAFGTSIVPYIDASATVTVIVTDEVIEGTDDTEAWSAWRDAAGGIKYAPAGMYLVDGQVIDLPNGFLGRHGFTTGLPSADYNKSYNPAKALIDGSAINIVKNTVGSDVSPCISVEHTIYDDTTGDLSGVKPKAAGIYSYVEQIGGHTVNAPKAICGVTVNGANGDNDSSGIVGYSYHMEAEGGIGDTAGGGMVAWQYSTQEGLVIGGEFSAHQNALGTRASNYAKNGNNTMSIHVSTDSNKARCFAGIAMDAKNTDKATGHGFWNALLISRSCFSARGGSGLTGSAYEPGTVGINFANNTSVCAEKQMWSGNAKWHNYRYSGDIRTHCAGFVLSSQEMGGDCHLRFILPPSTSGGKMANSASVSAYAGTVDSDGKSVMSRVAHLTFANTGYVYLATATTSVALSGMTNVFYPTDTGVTALGAASKKWTDIYATNGIIQTSDERLKTDISSVPDVVLDAWGDVGWTQFRFNDAVTAKGDNARQHTGLIAQRVQAVFADRGLDAMQYGLLCYDAWSAEAETVISEKVIISPEECDDLGNVLREEVSEVVEKKIPGRDAGEMYSVRYEEALAMEAAYQRRRADRMEARIAALEAAIDKGGA